jgi:hypothetical protein
MAILKNVRNKYKEILNKSKQKPYKEETAAQTGGLVKEV